MRLTGWVCASEPGEPAVLDVFLGERSLASVIRALLGGRTRLAPSSGDMAGASVMLPALERREFRLRDALVAELPGLDYTYVFVDCPPSLGLLTVNSLVAADQVIIPVQAEYFALEGLAQLMSTISAVKERLNPSLKIAGLVLTMVDYRTTLARDVEQEIRPISPASAIKTIVPRNVRLAEAPSHGLPVSMSRPALHWIGRVLLPRNGGCRPWLKSRVWAGGWPPFWAKAILREAGAGIEAPAEHTLSGGGGVIDLPVNLIRRNPRQPRRAFDVQALEELATSIAAVGSGPTGHCQGGRRTGTNSSPGSVAGGRPKGPASQPFLRSCASPRMWRASNLP